MKILLLGSGGREHALALAIKNSASCDDLFCWPGSDAIATISKRIKAKSLAESIKIAAQKDVQLCVVGEEKQLVEKAGANELCRQVGIKCWGPPKNAAMLEASKIFAKEFMMRHGIPNAKFVVAENLAEAQRLSSQVNYPHVIKFDGLAAGKGVKVCQNSEEAEHFLNEIFIKNLFGKGRIIFEQCLTGSEISVFCAVSGKNYQILLPARDYKRLKDDDKGLNTGGMGAIASQSLLSEEKLQIIEEKIIKPTILGMEAEDFNYRGFLYFALMLSSDSANVLEYNCRFGDPEAQAVLPMMVGDFASWLANWTNAKLEDKNEQKFIDFKSGWSMSLVFATQDYPVSANCGNSISGLEKIDNCQIYHSGTRLNSNNNWETNGGRVLSLCAQDADLWNLRNIIYQNANKINFTGMQFRKDIGRNLS